MKFLFVTDSHFRDTIPVSRIDNIMNAQLSKLNEIFTIAREHKADAILHGGDFFDTKRPSHRLIVDLMNSCKRNNVPIYIILGNHDLVGFNLDSVKGTGLGVLLESGTLQLLDKDLVFAKDRIVIKAVPTSLNFQQNYQFLQAFSDHMRIIISHNYIIPEDSMPFGFIHPKDIQTNAHLVLCGHYHVPFDYSTQYTRWINPGALCRWSISEKKRKPQVLLVTIDEGKIDIETIVLKSAKPADEIFNLEYEKQENKREQDIQSFVSSLNSTIFSSVDIEEVVRRSGKDQNLDQLIIDEAVKRIRSAKEVLK